MRIVEYVFAGAAVMSSDGALRCYDEWLQGGMD
jgi:hypothetical protein